MVMRGREGGGMSKCRYDVGLCFDCFECGRCG